MLNRDWTPKQPIENADPNQPKPAEVPGLGSVCTKDPQPALPNTNNSARFSTKHTKTQQNHTKITPQREFYSTRTGQSHGHLVANRESSAAIWQSASKTKSGPPHLRAAKNTRSGRLWPLVCVAHWRVLCPPLSLSLPAASKNRYIRPAGQLSLRFCLFPIRTKPWGAPGSKPKAC